MIDDILGGFEFELLRREAFEDRGAIVLRFRPSEDVEFESKIGKTVFSKVLGHAWIDESDFRLVRVEAEIVEDVTLGPFGSLARIHKGTQYLKEWREIDDVWLPSSLKMTLKVRTLLMRTSRKQIVEEYSDYRKFSLDPSFMDQVD